MSSCFEHNQNCEEIFKCLSNNFKLKSFNLSLLIIINGNLINMFELIPKHVRKKFKNSFLKKHMWFHYLVHSSYYLFNDNITRKYTPHYKYFTPKDWLESNGSFFEEKERNYNNNQDLRVI